MKLIDELVKATNSRSLNLLRIMIDEDDYLNHWELTKLDKRNPRWVKKDIENFCKKKLLVKKMGNMNKWTYKINGRNKLIAHLSEEIK